MSIYEIITLMATIAMALFGGNVVVQVTGYFKNQVLRDARDEEVAKVVLGDGDAHPGLPKMLSALTERVGSIEHEIQPNSGGSMRDSVNRIEHTVVTLASRVDTLEDNRVIRDAASKRDADARHAEHDRRHGFN